MNHPANQVTTNSNSRFFFLTVSNFATWHLSQNQAHFFGACVDWILVSLSISGADMGEAEREA